MNSSIKKLNSLITLTLQNKMEELNLEELKSDLSKFFTVCALCLVDERIKEYRNIINKIFENHNLSEYSFDEKMSLLSLSELIPEMVLEMEHRLSDKTANEIVEICSKITYKMESILIFEIDNSYETKLMNKYLQSGYY